MKKNLVVATVIAGLTCGFAGVAGAQVDGYQDDKANSDNVDPGVLPAPVDPPAVVESGGVSGVEVKGKQQLPVTGGDAAGLALVGTLLVAGGGLLVWRSKAVEVV